MSAVEQAIDTYGGAAALARRLGISRNAISLWRQNGRVPQSRIDEVERLTGISRHDLRPDIFGPAPTVAASEAVAP